MTVQRAWLPNFSWFSASRGTIIQIGYLNVSLILWSSDRRWSFMIKVVDRYVGNLNRVPIMCWVRVALGMMLIMWSWWDVVVYLFMVMRCRMVRDLQMNSGSERNLDSWTHLLIFEVWMLSVSVSVCRRIRVEWRVAARSSVGMTFVFFWDPVFWSLR